MKYTSLGLAGLLFAGGACAAVEPPLATPARPAAVARPGTFAASSVPFAKRLTPEQRGERRFLKDAAATSRFESDAARMALAKSADPNVRSLAATLVNHHAALQSALHEMLHSRNMAPPMLSNDQRKVLNHIAKLNGVKFEREWVEQVALRSQQENVAQFERGSQAAHDARLRSWIERNLPTLRYHVQTAERIVTTGTKFAALAPLLPQVVAKAPAPANVATHSMGAGPASAPNPADLGEGNMLLGPARPVAVKLTEPNTR